MPILVDTSVWIEYFRHGKNLERLDFIIDENLVVTNDLILAELIPFLKIRKQNKIISLLHNINKLPININWEQIIEFQHKCLKNGLNGVGIPDLIIAQNAKQNGCEVYTLDNHFQLIKNIVKLELTT
ncbi:MAG: PIN domain-containing protein [Desulfurivibrionaceae bacterium]|jgi:predicted nucleic acid-binding protein|nr:PIN domain-containing protein [Pseudomonadota bacterium]MCG2822317.1 PIN domain-containing protein [Desulfobulbaceae bacterium]MDP2002248.1 PIN domain-containing protein [Desulfurivibrionaceae bacterium]MDP2756116.1 PIN domain-containing protein [Desulfurivibrionaceae bacterium]PKN23266.1 MAG: PIN domain nuclease [Deltaproteobacteria bacterium HGW-Deltaproteobacteria-3]